MIACAVLRDGNRTRLDYDFMFDVRGEDGELRFAKINPVRVLMSFMDSPRIVEVAREVWLGDWVLDCDSGEIVLGNDYTRRSLRRRVA